MSQRSAGVLYVATERPRFVTEAQHSAESLKRWMPDVHITLFTDRTDTVCASPFDTVEYLPRVDGIGCSWGWGLLNKVRACAHSPYERTLFLDTDTRVLTPRIREVFALLDTHEIALARCEPGESHSQDLYGRPVFNGGVIAFRRTPRVSELLNAWRDLHLAHLRAFGENRSHQFAYVRHLDAASRCSLLINDQTALARHLAPDGVNTFEVSCLTLPRIWNWRRKTIDATHVGDVVIHHSNRFKVDDSEPAGAPRPQISTAVSDQPIS
jgi:hypothetical protein